MKKLVIGSIISGLLFTASPSNDLEQEIIEVRNLSKAKTSDLLGKTSNNTVNYTIPDEESIDNPHLSNINIFPDEVQTIGVKRMADMFLWNMAKSFSPEHPALVDTLWEHLIYCAGTMKAFILYTKSHTERTDAEDRYTKKSGIHARILPIELEKLGFTQKFNFMTYLDFNKMPNNNIVHDDKVNAYNVALFNLGNYLKEDGKVGSLLPIYFNLSGSKDEVKEWNLGQIAKNPNFQPHINTHQAMFLGNGYKEFQADNVQIVKSKRLSKMVEEVNIIDYIANFVQQRSGYRSGLKDKTKEKIKEQLSTFGPLIDIEVNGVKIDLTQELEKSDEEKIQVKPSDTIKISGPVLLDGYHNANSENMYVSKNNHVRTMFYFEFLLPGVYTPSELIEPEKEDINEKSILDIRPDTIDDLQKKLKVNGGYSLKAGENLSINLKEKILLHKFGKEKELKYTPNEIEQINELETLKIGFRDTQLRFYEKQKVLTKRYRRNKKELKEKLRELYNNLSKNDTYKKIKSKRKEINSTLKGKIENIINSLSPKERQEFYKEYKLQIKGLQIMGYMQHEGKMNIGTTKINAPIPYFDSSNIKSIFEDFIKLMKKILKERSKKDCNDCKEKEYVEIGFFPGDNSAEVFNQLEYKLQIHSDKYPNFKLISKLDKLKKSQLLDEVIDKTANDKRIDISAGKIPSLISVFINIEKANSVFSKIIEESHIEEVKVGETDEAIISKIGSIKQDYDILSYGIAQETYENGLPERKLLKRIRIFFENLSKNSKINFIKAIAKEISDLIGTNSSFGDYQLKIFNLLDKKVSLKEWPSKESLRKAIGFVRDLIENSGTVKRRFSTYPEIQEADLAIVDEIEKELDSMNEENRLEKGRKIYKLLKKLFRYNGTNQENIIGKIMQMSLTIDKINGHTVLINGWLNKIGIPIDKITNSNDLKERFMKTVLVAHQRGEKVSLIGVAENYILRIMETLGDNIKKDYYPKLEKNYKSQIDYGEKSKVTKNHFLFYKERLKTLASNNNEVNDLKKELDTEITNILNGNFSSDSIFKLFQNKKIKNKLEESGIDSFPLPTLQEFIMDGFRRLFFDYTVAPHGRTPPKDYDIKMILGGITASSLVGLGTVIGAPMFYFRRKRKKKLESDQKKKEKSYGVKKIYTKKSIELN